MARHIKYLKDTKHTKHTQSRLFPLLLCRLVACHPSLCFSLTPRLLGTKRVRPSIHLALLIHPPSPSLVPSSTPVPPPPPLACPPTGQEETGICPPFHSWFAMSNHSIIRITRVRSAHGLWWGFARLTAQQELADLQKTSDLCERSPPLLLACGYVMGENWLMLPLQLSLLLAAMSTSEMLEQSSLGRPRRPTNLDSLR